MQTDQAFAICIALCLAPGCGNLFGGKGIPGSGVQATEERAVEAFDSIEVCGAFNVTVSCGARQRVAVSGDDNLLPHVTIAVDGGRLIIEPGAKLSPTVPIEVAVDVETLAAVEGAGAINLVVSGLDAPQFRTVLNGTGSFRAAGCAGELTAVVNGAGSLDYEGLIAETGSITINGAGAARVHFTRQMHVAINGTGRVVYTGDPQITQSIAGVGSLSKR